MSGAEATEGGEPSERKGQRTRRQILEAARAEFAQVGYDRATIRGIAAKAGIDKSSVVKYFGTKQNLFREAATWSIPRTDTGSVALRGADDMVRGMFNAWSAAPNTPMAVLLRTSMTSEEAAEILRDHLSSQVIPPFAAAIDEPDARLRAALAGAMLMGIASQRYLLGVPDVTGADEDAIVNIVAPAIAAIIDPRGVAEQRAATTKPSSAE